MGHASIATTSIYIRYLGTSADRVALERLNCGATPGAQAGRNPVNDTVEIVSEKPNVPPCQRALTLVELRGFEPLTFSLRTRRATNCATAPGAPDGARKKVPPVAGRFRIGCRGVIHPRRCVAHRRAAIA